MCRKLSEPISVAPEVQNKIIEAFKNSSYRWRTAEGIATESQIDFTLVFNFLFFNKNIISSGKTNNRGEQLFALREKYLNEIPTKIKILNAITHRFH